MCQNSCCWPPKMHQLLFVISELKNHDDDFVDDDRKWIIVYSASATSKFRRRGVVDLQVVVVLNDLITLALYLSWASLEGTRNSPAQQLGQENVSCSSFRGASGIVWDLETEVTGVGFWDNENHGFGEHELAYQVKWARCWLWFASALRLRALGQAMKIMIE